MSGIATRPERPLPDFSPFIFPKLHDWGRMLHVEGETMAVIDAHAHIYPEKIATRAVEAVGAFYGVEMFDGHLQPRYTRGAACLRGYLPHHALHRPLGCHDAPCRDEHQRFHRRASARASRVHRLRHHASRFRGQGSRGRTRNRAWPARLQDPPRHADGRYG